jgi:hypothetical protein
VQDLLNFFIDRHEIILSVLFPAILSIFIYMKGKKKKSLSFFIKSKTKLFTVHDKTIEHLEILLDKKPVRDAHVFILTIMHTGNEPISPKDYEEELKISFPETVTILSAAIIETRPRNFNVNYTLSEHTVCLDKFLLNPKDSITFKFLLSNDCSDPVVSARIAGVAEISEFSAVPDKIKYFFASDLWFYISMILIYGTIPLVLIPQSESNLIWVGVGTFFAGISLFWFHMFGRGFFSMTKKR